MNLANVNIDWMQLFVEKKQNCNEDKCRCECKELIDKGNCNKEFIWNPSICDYNCDITKFCDFDK